MPLILDPPFKTLDSGLVLYVPLWAGELSGDSFNSKDTNKHQCTNYGSLWTPQQGRSFDGVDDYLDVGSAAILDNLPASDFSLWFCIKINTFAIQRSIFNKSSTFYIRLLTSGNIRLLTGHATTNRIYLSSTGTLVVDKWYFIEINGKASNLSAQIFINGQETTYTTATNGVGNYDGDAASSLEFGRFDTEYASAVLGEVGFRNKTISALEALNNYLQAKWRYS